MGIPLGTGPITGEQVLAALASVSGQLSSASVAGVQPYAGWAGGYDPFTTTNFGPAEFALVKSSDATLGYESTTGKVKIGATGAANARMDWRDEAGLIDPSEVFMQFAMEHGFGANYGWWAGIGCDPASSLSHWDTGFDALTRGFALLYYPLGLIMLANGDEPDTSLSNWREHAPPPDAGWWSPANIAGISATRSTTDRSVNAVLTFSDDWKRANADGIYGVGIEVFKRWLNVYWGRALIARWTWAEEHAPFRTARGTGAYYSVQAIAGPQATVDGAAVEGEFRINAMVITPPSRAAADEVRFV